MTNVFDIYNIPDFDQRRAGLPGNGGMYCAPTSTFNNIHFMGQHGVPELLNCPLDPDNVILNSKPDFGVTLRLAQLGAYDGTDPVNGGGQSGTFGYLQALTNRAFMVITYYRSEGFPAPDTMASWMRMGGLVTVCYGRYTNPFDSSKNRDGGHCVTMTGLTTRTSSPSFTLRYRDPAGDEGSGDPNRLSKQSPFATTEYDLHPEYANFGGTQCVLYGIGDKPQPNPTDPFWYWRARYAYIDGYQVIFPYFALTGVSRSDVGLAASANHPGKLALLMSARFDAEKGYGDPVGVDLSSLLRTDLVDVAIDRVRPTAVVASAHTSDITEIDLADRTSRTLTQLPAQPKRIVFGGHDGALFVLMDGRLGRLERDGKLYTIPAPPNLEALAFDDKNRHVVVTSDSDLFTFDEHLAFQSKIGVSLPGRGRLTIQINTTRSEVLAHREGDAVIQAIGLRSTISEGPRDIALKDTRHPVTFALGQNEAVLVNDSGQLREYGRGGTLNREARLNGMPVGDILTFPRNIDNAEDVGVHGPAWRNLLPDETATAAR
jgi:hypothetical protein